MDKIEQAIREEMANNFYWYRKFLHGQAKRDRDQSLVKAYANRAELEAYRAYKIGHELNKLQQRIGRQRVANRKLQRIIQEKDLAIDNAHEYARAIEVTMQKEIDGLNEQLTRERAARRLWGAGYTVGRNKESSTSTGFDSTTEHGTGETTTDGA